MAGGTDAGALLVLSTSWSTETAKIDLLIRAFAGFVASRSGARAHYGRAPAALSIVLDSLGAFEAMAQRLRGRCDSSEGTRLRASAGA